MAASLLPNGKQQFTYPNGDPLAGGMVHFYIPGTNQPKNTWQDPDQIILNTNPVVLDQNGQAIIYGSGAYRQILRDAQGNTIWDTLTQDTVGAGIRLPYGPDTGVVNAIVATVSPDVPQLFVGLQVIVRILNTNTGATTANIQSTGVRNIITPWGTPTPPNTLVAGADVTLTFDGGSWQCPATNYNIQTNPNISVAPTGNPLATLASLNVQADAVSATQREFLLCVGLTSAVGANPPSGTFTDKVAIYAGMVGNAGTTDIWSFNTVTTMNPSSGSYNSQGYELDVNNLNAHRGDATWGSGYAAPVSYGLSITGASSFRNTAAILISGPGTGHWNRGIGFVNNSIVQVGYQDLCNSTKVFEIFGTHEYGLDLVQASFSGAPVRIANGNAIKSVNSGGTDCSLIQASGNNIVIGDNNTAGLFTVQGFFPMVTQSLDLGQPSVQWHTLYCVTVVTSSDREKKCDIRDLPDFDHVVRELSPKVFKWKIGGSEEIEELRETDVPVTERVRKVEEKLEVVNGRPVMHKHEVTVDEPIYDLVNVLDESGRTVMVEIPEVPAKYDGQGRLVSAAIPARREPMQHRVARTERKLMPHRVRRERPGKRDHLGFMAQDVQEAFRNCGLDFAGYVEGEDGSKHIRPDQLVPVLWSTVQRLLERESALIARVATLEAYHAGQEDDGK